MKRLDFLLGTLQFLFASNLLTRRDLQKLNDEIASQPAPALEQPAGRDHTITLRGHFKVKGNPNFPAYQKLVHELTAKQPIETLPDFDKRGFNNYHLDHKVSIYSGFRQGLPAEEIAHISNLRMIPSKENMTKGCTSI